MVNQRTGVGQTVIPAVRAVVGSFDSDLPLSDVALLEQTVHDSLAEPRLATNLLGLFGLLALLLAAVGIYGVISYSVAGRTREIGIRAALGAEAGDVTRMIVGEGARPLLAGLAVGLGLAWWSTRAIESLLYGVTPTDSLTFVVLPAALLAVGIAASLIPALRATGISPTEALRED
jgi:putative ABC transport system permease protein